ncbi:MAG: hypothetical protein IJH64_04825 [Oscillospiraceae bacterium]|nr:hypothetical protein [Oscillospiraceae bacterium]
MTPEEKARITTEKIKKLNPTNLMLIDSGVSLLLARQELERAKEVENIMSQSQLNPAT